MSEKRHFQWGVLAVVLLAVIAVTISKAGKPRTPTPKPTGRPQIVDLGSTVCIPCRKMQPILERLREKYRGRVDVVFIDINEQPDQADAYRVTMIPTQVFLDAKGREVWRHVGFLDQAAIEAQLRKMGIR